MMAAPRAVAHPAGPRTSDGAIWAGPAGCGGAVAVCGRDRHAKLGNTPDVPPGPAGLSCICRHQAHHAEIQWHRVPGPGTESLEPVVGHECLAAAGPTGWDERKEPCK